MESPFCAGKQRNCYEYQSQQQCGAQRDRQCPPEAQPGDGGDLTGENGRDGIIPAQRHGEQPNQSCGEKTVEQLTKEIGAGAKTALPDKGQYLAVYRQPSLAQNKRRHAHSASKRSGHIPKAPNPGGHFNGAGQKTFRHILPQAQTS